MAKKIKPAEFKAPSKEKGYVFTVTERLHQQGIKCLECGRTSYNPNDIKFLYCGHCNKFHTQKST
jgi:ribosomal protein L37E